MSSNRILLISSEFPPQPGGIGNHAYNLAKGFRDNNIDIIVHTNIRSSDGKEEHKFDTMQPFSVIRIPRKKIILFTYLKRVLSAYKLSSDRDTILVSGKFSIWIGGILRLLLKKRVIAVIHGSEVLLPNIFLRKSVSFCLRRFESVIAVSTYTGSLVSDLGIKDLTVIPNGYHLDDTDDKIRTWDRNKPVQLITVGNVTHRKGQHNVIKILPDLVNDFPGIHYHIVGIPTKMEALIELATNLGVLNNVTFHGEVNETEKIYLLLSATIFVMLSEKTKKGDVEGFGIAILEANSLGIPAIGSLGCGIEDAIKDGYSGKLTVPNDKNAFKESLRTILNDYETYSSNSKKWSLRFDWKIIINEYLKKLNGKN